MQTTISCVHNGTTITYDESDNKWRFTLRGRDRSADSLPQAREFIDKPVSEKVKPFEKIAAWKMDYDRTPERVEVTGIAERRFSREEVWIKDSEGKRSKESVAYRIYASDSDNDATAKEIIALDNEISKLKEKRQSLRQTMKGFLVPQE